MSKKTVISIIIISALVLISGVASFSKFKPALSLLSLEGKTPNQPDSTSEKPKVKEIWEKVFESPIKDFVIENQNGKSYLKVLISDKGVTFLGRNGEIKKGRILNRGSISKSKMGKAIGVWEVLETDQDKDLIIHDRFTFFDNEGNIVWEKEDIGGGCMVSDDGETAVSFDSVMSGIISFYNSRGLIKKIKPLESFEDGYGVFSEDGKYYAIVTGWPSVLVLYDNLGNELWRESIVEDRAYDICISPGQEYITFLAHDTKQQKNYVYSFKINGELVWKKEGLGVYEEGCAFSPDSTYLTLTSKKEKTVNLIHISTGKVMWEQSFVGDKMEHLREYIYINSMEIFRGSGFVIVSQQILTYYIATGAVDPQSPRYVYLYNLKGEIVWKKEFYSDPKVRISSDGTEFYISAGQKITGYIISF